MENALLLLKQLYEVSEGSVDYEANFNEMAADMNLDCVERDNAFRSLLNQRYIFNTGMGYGCTITSEGIGAIVNMNNNAATRRRSKPRFNIKFAEYFKAISTPKILDYK
jgi:hypothetical protein